MAGNKEQNEIEQMKEKSNKNANKTNKLIKIIHRKQFNIKFNINKIKYSNKIKNIYKCTTDKIYKIK